MREEYEKEVIECAKTLFNKQETIPDYPEDIFLCCRRNWKRIAKKNNWKSPKEVKAIEEELEYAQNRITSLIIERDIAKGTINKPETQQGQDASTRRCPVLTSKGKTAESSGVRSPVGQDTQEKKVR